MVCRAVEAWHIYLEPSGKSYRNNLYSIPAKFWQTLNYGTRFFNKSAKIMDSLLETSAIKQGRSYGTTLKIILAVERYIF